MTANISSVEANDSGCRVSSREIELIFFLNHRVPQITEPVIYLATKEVTRHLKVTEIIKIRVCAVITLIIRAQTSKRRLINVRSSAIISGRIYS